MHQKTPVRISASMLVCFFCCLSPVFSKAQDLLVQVQGRVFDQATKDPLVGAAVLIKNTVSSTITGYDGRFKLQTKLQFPFTIVVTYVGYETREFEVKNQEPLDISIPSKTVIAEEMVVTASRREESNLKSPVAIEKLDIRAIKETPAPSFYDALENLKGVQTTTSSLTFKVPNTRGFNIPNNFRFMQMVDGVDMQASTLGVPLGNAIGPPDIDVASVEITPGAASALYGMNAINGLANIITKDPFLYQGLSVYQRTGINHVDGKDFNPSVMTETALRYAKAFKNKVAFKFSGSYFQGTDWASTTVTDQNPQNLSTANPAFPSLSGDFNPAYDAWNKYGDERNNNVPVSVFYNGKDQTFNVRRTGYWEKDLFDPKVRNAKADAELRYRISDKLELGAGYRFGLMDGTFQRGNKIRLDKVTVQSVKLDLKGANFSVKAYLNMENTGNSYNLKPLADNLDLTHLSNTAWGNRYQSILQTALNNGIALETAHQMARDSADAGRVLPGTDAFGRLKDSIVSINNWDHAANVTGAPSTGGAWLSQKSRLWHVEGQYDFSHLTHRWIDILAGFDFRSYEVIPDGNNFVDFSRPIEQRSLPGGKNLFYTKYGMFVQLTRNFFGEKLKVVASVRLDNNLEFKPRANPRVAIVYSPWKNHHFRASFQNGYRFPALFEALSYVNNGNVRRVGGLPGVDEGFGYLENSYTLTSVDAFNAAVNAEIAAGVNRSQAALRNRGILEKADLQATQPERINSFEIGYKSLILNSKISIDWDAYFNIYDGFLGQVEVAVPVSGSVGSDAAVLDMLSRQNQTRFRVYTNAKNTNYNYGSSLGVTYNFWKKFTTGFNLSYNNILKNDKPDVFVTGFNTPNWVLNLSLGNREIVKNLGFNLVWRFQSGFMWESPLANGNVPSYNNLDLQINYRIPKIKMLIKGGATNVLNQRYIQYAAGPTIGGLYYMTISFEGLFN
jgi:iron complex outermembrane receptor protein